MLPQQYCLRWKYHHSNLQTMFSQLLDRGCFCDVTLACEGQLIRAHRVVLCACSTFFDTVLTNYASERDPIIIMKDVTFADVKCLIEFMYKGEINVEHANLASLLKTADDLKIKGLAEVSWRDDEEGGPPPPTPAAEYHSPNTDMYVATAPHDLHMRASSTPPVGDSERKSASPPEQRMPTLTPIANGTSLAANNSSSSNNNNNSSLSIQVSNAAVEQYLGPKRKRGRPPLDDAYDVFNIRKMAQYAAAQMDHQAYLESRNYAAASSEDVRAASPSAAAAAYQQHIQQQQNKHRLRLQRHQQQQQQAQQQQQHDQSNKNGSHDAQEHMHNSDEPQHDSEWINSNLEVNVSECDEPINKHKSNNNAEDMDTDIKETKPQIEDASHDESKLDCSNKAEKKRERTPEQLKKKAAAAAARKQSLEQQEQALHESPARAATASSPHTDEEIIDASVPQPVEDIENVQHVMEHQGAAARIPSASPSPPSTSSLKHSAAASLHAAHHFAKYSAQAGSAAAAALTPTEAGYLLNEHGMLMTHDFMHASALMGAAAAAAGSASSNANGHHAAQDGDYVDIKMEDYDAADLRLTSEEMSQWQDVIKMDDYLAKGRRPQFWEEPFTRRVLDAIKNKRLEMKKAARILGVSYGTLYGRYREVYGCLKHPYTGPAGFRPSQSSQLSAVQQRFDMVWPSPKRDSSSLMPAQMEIAGKLRPKDLSELWTRPQI